MSFYGKYILPYAIHWVMGQMEFQKLRGPFLQPLKGKGLEIGFGSGLNLPFYPRSVLEMVAFDPVRTGRKLARRKLENCPFPLRFMELHENRYPLESNSLDFVLSTWTLCTIANVKEALQEIYRVLKVEGRFFFMEHGLSPDPRVSFWQNHLNTLQKTLAGGCHLNRPIDQLVKKAGFQIVSLKNFYMKGPKTHAYLYQGIAQKVA